MNADRIAIEEALRSAAARLAGKRLLTSGGILSQRIPELDAFVCVAVATAQRAAGDVRWSPLSGAPANLHARIYAARADVGAILSGDLAWTGALGRLGMSLPAVFDEQVRHLGVEAKRVAMLSTDDRPIGALSNGASAYCLDDVALCLGMGLERLLLNIEILEKCAESFVLAQCASAEVKRIPWLVGFIANGRLKKDRKDAAARHLRGERSIMKAGY